MALMCWVWQTGTDEHGAPVLAKRIARAGEEPPAAGAWLAEQDPQALREEILRELEEIDRRSIRALREPDAGHIAALEARAEELRRMLQASA